MINPEHYRGREQTYVKHVFLDNYLERVAWVTLANGRGWSDFVYLDGFSGPWKSNDESFSDTSVKIALRKLSDIRDGLAARQRSVQMKALFVEQHPDSYQRLKGLLAQFPAIQTTALEGNFHRLSADCARKVGSAFSLAFIDPTSFAIDLEAMAPVLRLRGEIIINFMYSFLIRNFDVVEAQEHLARTFACNDWREKIAQAEERIGDREEATLSVFCSAVRRISGKKFVTATRVKWPLANRTYFHLVYATDHWRGLDEFRNVEKRLVEQQEHIRSTAKASARHERTGMPDLFPESFSGTDLLEVQARRDRMKAEAERSLLTMLEARQRLTGKEVFEVLLQLPLISRAEINEIILAARENGKIHVGFGSRERTLKPDTGISLA